MSSQGEFDVTLRLFYGSDGVKKDDVETTVVVQPCSVLDVFVKYNLDLRSSDFKRRLEEMEGAPIEDLKQALKETWVAYQSFDGDAAVDGAAVELDAVVAGPATLIVRERVIEDAFIRVQYKISDKAYSLFDLSPVTEIPNSRDCYDYVMGIVAREARARTRGPSASVLRHLMDLAPEREDLEFSVAASYSAIGPEDETYHTEIRDGHFTRVDASAKVSEVVESQRGRRRCHVLLVDAACKGPSVSRDGAPKRALKAYTIFAWERRPALEKQGMSLGEIGPPRRPVEGAFLAREALISRR